MGVILSAEDSRRRMNSDPVDLSIAPEFRPLPLWAWNGEMTVERISKTLTDFRDRGFGGAFIHPRPGLIIEYLSEKWFELWRFAQETATELGLTVHIYDENSFPSGFAGGHVLAARPELRLNRLVCIAADAHTDGTVVAQFEHVSSHFKIVREPTEKSGWYADGTYVDLLNPETANVFTQITHHRYDREVNSFGLMAFSDEPAVMDYSRGALPWSETIEEAFAEEHGYRLQPNLPSLFVDVDSQSPKVRYDFQTTLMRLFQINFVEPLASACKKYGMRLTGHLHEHEWPCPRYQANTMLAMAGFHTPGIDLLGFQVDLSDCSSHGRWLLTILEVTSLADQLGKRTVLCEAYGGGGYETTLADLKRQGDYLLAGGINLLVPHMSYETMVGARKYDWPQTISDHASFWDDIGPLHEHQARVASILSRGVSTADTLVLHPTATGWLDWTPDSSAVGREQELPLKTTELRSGYSEFLQSLADRYLDFHLGDEWILEARGRSYSGMLSVGDHSYSTVIIPPQMETIRLETLDLLERFSSVGGRVVAFDSLPTRLEGVLSEEPSLRLDKIATQLESIDHLAIVQPLIKGPNECIVPPGLQVIRRKLADRKVYFVANPWSQPLTAEIAFEAESLLEVNTITGASQPVSSTQSLQLASGEHRLWIENTDSIKSVSQTFSEIPFELNSVTRIQSNCLPIDACSLVVGEQIFDRTATIVQNRNLWREHGLPGDPWEWGVQFKRDFVDSTLPASPGFVATYTFSSEIECDIQICVERPWLYTVLLNGSHVTFDSDPFFDEEMRLSKPQTPRRGTNKISIRAETLQIHHELAPTWVMGDFAVYKCVLHAPRALGSAGWAAQGLPNYPWTVEYLGNFSNPAGGAVELEIRGHGYSSAEIALDGTTVSRYWGDGGWLPLGDVSAGTHELKVLIRGNLRNLLGPYGVEGLPGPWLWTEAAEIGFAPTEQRVVRLDSMKLRTVQ